MVEGKVVSKTSFWDSEHKKIYTANTLEVYKVFKGDDAISTIEEVTVGGTVGFDALMVFPSLKLQVGDIGVFTLYETHVSLSSKTKTQNKQFEVYSLSQGFYKYNLHTDAAINPFSKTQGVTSLLYRTHLDLFYFLKKG